MLKYNKHLEIINTLTGFILVIASIIYWQQKNIESSASWFVFGAMYLVMDSYKVNSDNNLLGKVFSIIRVVFSVAGFTASFLFLIYILVN